MISVSLAVDDIVNRRPFIREGLSQGIVNVSALALQIQSEVSSITNKEVGQAAIVMAIRRMAPNTGQLATNKIAAILRGSGNITVRSELNIFTYNISDTTIMQVAKLMDIAGREKSHFCTLCRGVSETTLIASKSLKLHIEQLFSNEKLKSKAKNLSSVTIELPSNNTVVSGVYYQIFKTLAWENIHVIEAISTSNEFTLVVEEEMVAKTFSLIKGLKNGV